MPGLALSSLQDFMLPVSPFHRFYKDAFSAFCNIAFNCFHFSNVLHDNVLNIQSVTTVLSYDKRTKRESCLTETFRTDRS